MRNKLLTAITASEDLVRCSDDITINVLHRKKLNKRYIEFYIEINGVHMSIYDYANTGECIVNKIYSHLFTDDERNEIIALLVD